MALKRKTLFLSDVHLAENGPHITAQFCALLKYCEQNPVDAIYILGDLFEVWIGDDDSSGLHQTVISALKRVTAKNIPIYFMHGNRDFLIGKKFSQMTGCELLPDEKKINVYGIPVLLMHGDTLCTQDINYLKARKNAHNKFNQFIFLHLPLFIRKKIANHLREKSRRYTAITPIEIMDVTQSEVEAVLAKYTVQLLIHGHTHRPAIHTFIDAQGVELTRIVLNAWHEKANAFVWESTGERNWIEWSSIAVPTSLTN